LSVNPIISFFEYIDCVQYEIDMPKSQILTYSLFFILRRIFYNFISQ